MSGTHLPGLEGTNPLGFLAALGVQVAFANEDAQPRLGWDVTDDRVYALRANNPSPEKKLTNSPRRVRATGCRYPIIRDRSPPPTRARR